MLVGWEAPMTSRHFPPPREAMRGTCIGVWRLDSALARPQPPKPRPSVSRRAKGVTGLLSQRGARGAV
jgi:hypothetical protein